MYFLRGRIYFQRFFFGWHSYCSTLH